MRFIGRETELEKRNKEYERDNGFVVIYGRRRVGKTTLIKEFYSLISSPFSISSLIKQSVETLKKVDSCIILSRSGID